MDFREEYKKCAEVMNPSAEAVDRMTNNILAQINAPAKKAVPFKKISYFGGAIAACAVITIGAVAILPRMGSIGTANEAAVSSPANAYQENYALLADGAAEDADIAMDGFGYAAEDTTTSTNADCIVTERADSDTAPSFTIKSSEPDNDAVFEESAYDEPALPDIAIDCTAGITEGCAPEADAYEDENEVFPTQDDLLFEISEDLSVLYIGGIGYTAVDEADFPYTDVVVTEYTTRYVTAGGTEYRIDMMDPDNIVLINGLDIIGYYTRISE